VRGAERDLRPFLSFRIAAEIDRVEATASGSCLQLASGAAPQNDAGFNRARQRGGMRGHGTVDSTPFPDQLIAPTEGGEAGAEPTQL
jgi:hypothetical protein